MRLRLLEPAFDLAPVARNADAQTPALQRLARPRAVGVVEPEPGQGMLGDGEQDDRIERIVGGPGDEAGEDAPAGAPARLSPSRGIRA